MDLGHGEELLRVYDDSLAANTDDADVDAV
jgi:hypothetical protein